MISRRTREIVVSFILWGLFAACVWAICIAFARSAKGQDLPPPTPPATINVHYAACHWYAWNDGEQQREFGRIEDTAGFRHVVFLATTNVCLTNYGVFTASGIDGWNAFNVTYNPIIVIEARWTDGLYRGCEVDLRSFNRQLPYSGDSPGFLWLSDNLAQTINWQAMMWQAPGSYSPPQPPAAGDGAGPVSLLPTASGLSLWPAGGFDRVFLWWARNGLDGQPFDFARQELALDEAVSIDRCSVTVRTFAAPPYQPVSWGQSRTRCDITLTLPTVEADLARDCADINHDGEKSVEDIFTFLSCWFTGDGRGDWDGNAGFNLEDVWAYLSNWFSPE